MRGRSVAARLVLGWLGAALLAGCGQDDERPSSGDQRAGSGSSDGGAGGAAGAAGGGGAADDPGSSGAAGSSLIPAPEDVCLPAIPIADGETLSGNTVAWPRTLGTSCASEGSLTGPDAAFEFTASQSGMLDVELAAPPGFSISVRTVCADDTSELECSVWPELVRPIEAGDRVFIVVQGVDETVAGAFELTVSSRPVACGDGHRDAGEQCDDGNDAGSDGCSADCSVESSEVEPNDSAAEASALADPFFGTIEQADTDVIRVPITQGPSSIVASVRDFGDGACQVDRLNSVLELVDAQGAVLASSDDSLASYCSHLVASALPAGDYFLRIAAAPNTRTPAFPYVLDIALHACGDGVTEEGESCDPPAFGCSDTCQLE